VDLRGGRFQLAKSPLKIVGVVFLSPRKAGAHPLLRPLSKSDLRAKLAFEQAYGASQPQWQTFSRNISRLAAFELRRGRHPLDSVEALRSLLGNP
jgi:hypothetical protein